MHITQLLGRTLRVDHVLNYRKPKKSKPTETEKEEDLKEGVEEDDDEYETRRKKIWDFELYQTQGEYCSYVVSLSLYCIALYFIIIVFVFVLYCICVCIVLYCDITI